MPPAPVVRVQPSYQYDSKIQIAKVIPRKKDLIVYKSPKEILFLMYLNDPRISLNQEVLKLVKELRGGSWGLLGTAGKIFYNKIKCCKNMKFSLKFIYYLKGQFYV